MKKFILTFLIFAVPLIFYLLTLAPTILWNDSGELSTAVATLGIAHPTGYPLFILVGKIFILIPIGSVAYRLNLMSAILSSLTLVTLFLILNKLKKNTIVSIISVLVLGFSYTFWDQATFAEVYPLHIFLFSLIILSLLTWKEKKKYIFLYASIFLFGLSLTNHLLTLLILPAFLYFIFIQSHTRLFGIRINQKILNFKSILLLILFLAIGLLPYIYLPIRSLQNPILDWGNPENGLNFVRHVTGREFGYKMFHFSMIPKQIITQAENFFIKQFIVIFSIIGIIGAYILYKKNFRFFIFLLLIIISFLLYTLSYDIPDIVYYYLPLYLIFTIFIAFGLDFLYNALMRLNFLYKLKKTLFILFFAIILILLISINYNINSKKGLYFTYDYAKNVQKNLEENSIIITMGDDDLFPLLYYTLIENNSKNITIVHTIFLTKPWHTDQLRQRGIRITYNKTIPFYYSSKEQPQIVLKELIDNIIQNNYKDRPIYFTVYSYHENHINLSLPYYVVPKDHVYKVVTQEMDIISDLELTYRGLFDSNIKKDERTKIWISNLCNYWGLYYLEKEDFVKAKNKFEQAASIRPQSFVAHANLGYIHLIQNNLTRALNEYRKAYNADPENKVIYNNIILIESMLK